MPRLMSNCVLTGIQEASASLPLLYASVHPDLEAVAHRFGDRRERRNHDGAPSS